jgi:hypothetical protein
MALSVASGFSRGEEETASKTKVLSACCSDATKSGHAPAAYLRFKALAAAGKVGSSTPSIFKLAHYPTGRLWLLWIPWTRAWRRTCVAGRARFVGVA